MTDITEAIRLLNAQMMEQHQNVLFRVEQLAARLAQDDDALVQRLAEIHESQRSKRETARLLLLAIAETANIQPARQIQTRRIEDEHFEAPRFMHPAAEEVDRVFN